MESLLKTIILCENRILYWGPDLTSSFSPHSFALGRMIQCAFKRRLIEFTRSTYVSWRMVTMELSRIKKETKKKKEKTKKNNNKNQSTCCNVLAFTITDNSIPKYALILYVCTYYQTTNYTYYIYLLLCYSTQINNKYTIRPLVKILLVSFLHQLVILFLSLCAFCVS